MAEIGLISKEKMTSLANAVRQATGATGQLTVDQMSEKLQDIGGEPEKALRCYDYDGTVVYEYTIAEALALDALPDPPAHEGLVFQEWNWSLASIKAQFTEVGGYIDIGANYTTVDGATKFHIVVEKFNRSIYLGLSVKGSSVVDWGDGSETVTIGNGGTSSVSTWTPHEYATTGRYVISVSGGQISWAGTSTGSSLITNNGRTSTSSDYDRYLYLNMLREVNFGDNVTTLSSYSFALMYQLDRVSVSTSPTMSSAMDSSQYMFLPFIVNNRHTAIYGSRTLAVWSDTTNISLMKSSAGRFDYTPRYIPANYFESYRTKTLHIDRNPNASGAFCDSEIYSAVVFDEGITEIGGSKFSSMPSLRELVFPDSITSMKTATFQNDGQLNYVRWPSKVTTISDYTFSNCNSLRRVDNIENVVALTGGPFNNAYSLLEIELPDGITTLASTFSGNYSLQKVRLPRYIQTTTGTTFSNCYSLTEIEIPAYLYSIYSGTFTNCYSLKRVINNSCIPVQAGVDTADNGHVGKYATEVIGNVIVGDVVDGLTINRNTTSKCYLVTGYDGTTPSVNLGDRVIDGETYTCVGTKATTYFASNNQITEAVINTRYVGTSLFRQCRNLTTVHIGSDVRQLGTPNTNNGGVFYSCTSITSITFDEGVELLAKECFNGCNQLTEIVLPSTVSTLEALVFTGCTALKIIDFRKHTQVPALTSNGLGLNGTVRIVVPDAIYDEWITATNWSANAKYIVKASEWSD